MYSEISPLELKQVLDTSAENLMLLDVREPYEYEYGHLPALNIPLGELADRLEEIPRTGNVVVYCRAGSRSMQAIRYLASEHGYTNLMNLRGGLLGWKLEVDPEIAVY